MHSLPQVVLIPRQTLTLSDIPNAILPKIACGSLGIATKAKTRGWCRNILDMSSPIRVIKYKLIYTEIATFGDRRSMGRFLAGKNIAVCW
jgi:hypothetical protein